MVCDGVSVGGPKRVLLEEVREKYCLQHRVTMLGALHHSLVRDVRPRLPIIDHAPHFRSFLQVACAR